MNRSEWDDLARVVDDADVVMMGSCPGWMQRRRAKTGKLTFYPIERMWKMPLYPWRFLNPRFLYGIQRLRRIANRPNSHYLAIGQYAARDMQAIRAFGNRMWAWGYFIDMRSQSFVLRPARPLRILWVGRMLRLKRIDLILRAVSRLRDHPGFGQLDIVGAGPERASLIRLARRLEMRDKCVFHEPVPSARVRELMEDTDVYVLASDRHEGWGVVANEAMAEGAVLVANEQAGAARVLVKDGITGFLFANDDVSGLARILGRLADNVKVREDIGNAAAAEIRRLWYPGVGAARLVALSRGLLGTGPMPQFDDGPCSRVPAGLSRQAAKEPGGTA